MKSSDYSLFTWFLQSQRIKRIKKKKSKELINFEKKEMLLLTKKQGREYKKQKLICKE